MTRFRSAVASRGSSFSRSAELRSCLLVTARHYLIAKAFVVYRSDRSSSFPSRSFVYYFVCLYLPVAQATRTVFYRCCVGRSNVEREALDSSSNIPSTIGFLANRLRRSSLSARCRAFARSAKREGPFCLCRLHTFTISIRDCAYESELWPISRPRVPLFRISISAQDAKASTL